MGVRPGLFPVGYDTQMQDYSVVRTTCDEQVPPPKKLELPTVLVTTCRWGQFSFF